MWWCSRLTRIAVVNDLQDRSSVVRDKDFSFNRWWLTCLLSAWSAATKDKQEAVADILQAVAPSLACGVHTCRCFVVTESTINRFSAHPRGVVLNALTFSFETFWARAGDTIYALTRGPIDRLTILFKVNK